MSFVSDEVKLHGARNIMFLLLKFYLTCYTNSLTLQVDATEENNKALASKYEIQGFPTLKVSIPEQHVHLNRCSQVASEALPCSQYESPLCQ